MKRLANYLRKIPADLGTARPRVGKKQSGLRLEQLEDRWVPSAVTVDLTTRGATGVINDAIFQQCDAQPTGTGVIRSFVRVQTANSQSGVEHGYNTDARPLEFDENKSPQFTRSLKASAVPQVLKDGQLYREFLLDINQKSSQPNLSLDELRVFLGKLPNATGYDPATKQLAGMQAVYDMDAGLAAGEDNWVKLNYRLNAGSGAGDIFVYIPDSAFAGADSETYVYLYSKFGNHAGFEANAGFEEWAVRNLPPLETPPPPAVQLSGLSGYVYVDADFDGIFDSTENVLGGIVIELHGVNDLGQTVVLNATTDSAGFYQFTDLRPGTYTLLEHQPAGYDNGVASIGTQGAASADANRIMDIQLLAGVYGLYNNFGEWLFGGSS